MKLRRSMLIALLAISLCGVMTDLAAADNVGGTLIISSTQSLAHMNPLIGKGIYGYYAANSIFDSLVTINPETLEPAPMIAASWEVSDDAKVFTFYLNEGIKFSNGEALTAEDVKFSLDWTQDPANASAQMSMYSGFESVEVIDDYTLRITAEQSYPAGLTALQIRILPKDTFLQMGAEAFDSEPIGSGPYMMEEWIKGSQLTLVRNSNYWLTMPNLDRVIIRVIPDVTTAELELETGGVDITDTILPQDIERFQMSSSVNVQQTPGLSTQFVGFNAIREPYSNVDFREAVIQSIDMDKVISAVFPYGGATRAFGLVPASLWGNDREWLEENATLSEDDSAAKATFARLTAEGVIPDQFKMTILCPPDANRRKVATILAGNLIQNGIDAEVSPLEWGVYLDILFSGQADVYLLGWTGVGTALDPNEFLSAPYNSANSSSANGGYNMSCYSDSDVDAALDRADTIPNHAEREALYVQAQRIVIGRDHIHLPTYHEPITRGVSVRVHDFSVSPSLQVPFRLCTPFNNVWVDSE
jgi:peptide/nickel transport system substrate-binding protein